MIRLSYDLTEDQPIFPGNPQNKIKKITSIGKQGYTTHVVELFTHNGTHIDLPMHYIVDGKDITRYTIDDFIFHKPHILDISKQINAIEELSLEAGKDILLLHTGTKRNNRDCPHLTVEMAKEISTYDYKCVGIDCLSVTNPHYTIIGNKVHKMLLQNNIFILEDLNLNNVVNLGKMYVIPLFIKGIEGSPCTVFAEELK